MKIAGGMSEEGIVVGNTYDKYGSKNPIVRRIMTGFSGALSSLVAHAKPRSIHEVGCGEGYWVRLWNSQGIAARGSDFSEKVIELARENSKDANLPEDTFVVRSIYDLEAGGIVPTYLSAARSWNTSRILKRGWPHFSEPHATM